jgi:hypothetical protein
MPSSSPELPHLGPGNEPRDVVEVNRREALFAWLKSSIARKVFSFSSWVVVAWGVVFAFAIVFLQTPVKRTWTETPLVLSLVILWAVLLVISALAFILLIFGMAVFCAFVDPSPALGKVFWFILFFFGGPFSSAVYFFAVYRKLAPIRSEVINA